MAAAELAFVMPLAGVARILALRFTRGHPGAGLLAIIVVAAVSVAPLHAQDRAVEPPALDFAALGRAQPVLLKQELAQLAPRVKGTTNIYMVGVAGWDAQDVFIKELDGAIAAVDRILPVEGRVLKLVNHRSTLESVPITSPDNFAEAIKGVAAVMNGDQDVLVLFMTSHGSPWGLALRLGDAFDDLPPRWIASVLDQNGIRNRVVIVSACYSGSFVRPLANDNTIVLTAADEHHPSFGCSSQRDWTYFGDAFFNLSLRPGIGLRAAFEKAKGLIRGWELMDRFHPSNPQGYFGAKLMTRLQPILDRTARAGR